LPLRCRFDCFPALHPDPLLPAKNVSERGAFAAGRMQANTAIVSTI
jgi:hypothetical protein